VGHDQPRFVTGGGQGADEGSGLEELMGGFRRTANGATARFGAAQAAIIRDLVGQVAELVTSDMQDDTELDGLDRLDDRTASRPDDVPTPSADEIAEMIGLTGSAELPDDPVLARLLPDAYRDDPEASGEFRRYTEQGLRSGKAAAARTVLATLPPRGGRIRLSEPEAQAWLRALNDVRLALGVRLEVTDDFDEQVAHMAPDDPRSPYIGVYQWLAFLQESLVEALS
jgi:Domain of unknown function (DUF2017)